MSRSYLLRNKPNGKDPNDELNDELNDDELEDERPEEPIQLKEPPDKPPNLDHDHVSDFEEPVVYIAEEDVRDDNEQSGALEQAISVLRKRSEENTGAPKHDSQPTLSRKKRKRREPKESHSHENKGEKEYKEIVNCTICKVDVGKYDNGLCCDQCLVWRHSECLGVSDSEYKDLQASTRPWYCDACLDSTPISDLAWGSYYGENEIDDKLNDMYSNILQWKPNIFILPRGKAGKDFIAELTRLINLFNNSSPWKNLALKMAMIFPAVMLQKPSTKSKAKENAKYLTERLNMWHDGELDKLMNQVKKIQERIKFKATAKEDEKRKAFVRYMFEGKVSKAMRFIDHDEEATVGVLPINKNTLAKLEDKHPKAQPISHEMKIPEKHEHVEPVIFESIDTELIMKCTKSISGAGGPTRIDADTWKHLICSRFYGHLSSNLATAIAELAKILCTNDIPSKHLSELLAGRLIPLDKGGGGIRPIGIGEVLRRIISKAVTSVLKDEIQYAAGSLQACSGVEAGIEAAIHAMRMTFDQEETEGMLLVDATNAFNKLNRATALHNIKQICSSFHCFLNNCYKEPTKLIVNDPNNPRNYQVIYSQEGTTQGDPAAMAMYSLGTRPLIDILAVTLDVKTIQAWYADDSGACGKLESLAKWWDMLTRIGPLFGYFPNANKTVLIVKGKENLLKAKELFSGSGVKITDKGERHLGAVIGDPETKKDYVSRKVDSWIEDVERLAEISDDDPQLAYVAFTKGLCHRWKYVQRTINDISQLFIPLEKAIRHKLIPSIIGRHVSDKERDLIALPVRYGGMGIQNPAETCDREYQASQRITAQLTNLILKQDSDLSHLNKKDVKETKRLVKEERDIIFNIGLKAILSNTVDQKQQKILETAREKGSYSWLTALPLKSAGYVLNKTEFRDAVALRYGWKIPNLPVICQCGEKNSNDHALICRLGGYVIYRHDVLRDVEAEFLRECCRNVQVEPALQPTRGDHLRARTSREDQARADIAATGLWNNFERTFYDIRISHPFAKSNINKSTKQLYLDHENEKMTKYNQRIIEIEKATFCPLIYTTTGGTGPQCTAHHKKIAQVISTKRKERYEDVINFIRTKTRFALLRSTLVSLRGVRGPQKLYKAIPLSAISFGLVPEAPFCEA